MYSYQSESGIPTTVCSRDTEGSYKSSKFFPFHHVQQQNKSLTFHHYFNQWQHSSRHTIQIRMGDVNSSHLFLANCINICHKTEVQTVISSCLAILNSNWFKSYETKCKDFFIIYECQIHRITLYALHRHCIKYTANIYSFSLYPTFHCNLAVRFTFNCLVQSNVEVTVKKL